MNTTDIIAAMKERLAEVHAEAAKLRRMIDAAEGAEPIRLTGSPVFPYQPIDLTGGGTSGIVTVTAGYGQT